MKNPSHSEVSIAETPKTKWLPGKEDKPSQQTSFRFIDLFAGVGGLRLAFEAAGGKCVFSSEIDPFAAQTYEANFCEKPAGDITKIDASEIPAHDILVGGFPCQPFSIAGVSKYGSLGRKHGFDDRTKGTLFFEILRILAHHRPAAFLLENVKNLCGHDNGRTWLSRNEKILFDPGAGIHLPKRPKTLPRNYLSRMEINKLLRAPDTTTHLGLRNRAILETLYSTGIRNMELRNLKISDLNQTESWLTIRQGKGSKDRVVPIGKAALHFMEAYLEKTRPLFVRDNKTEFLFLSQHGEKLHPDTINQIINHTAARAKIKRRISAHALRHTCATAMLRGRADIRHIQEMLGHKSLASTQIYTKVEIGDLKRVHSRCHPREKEAIDKK